MLSIVISLNKVKENKIFTEILDTIAKNQVTHGTEVVFVLNNYDKKTEEYIDTLAYKFYNKYFDTKVVKLGEGYNLLGARIEGARAASNE